MRTAAGGGTVEGSGDGNGQQRRDELEDPRAFEVVDARKFTWTLEDAAGLVWLEDEEGDELRRGAL